MPDMSKIPDVSQFLLYEDRMMDPSRPTGLWFCASVYDVQTVGINACCLHMAGDWDDLNGCREFFELFPYVLILAADDAQRERMVDELRRRLNYMPLLVVPGRNFKGCKTVTEFYGNFGPKAVEALLCGAEELPAYGLLNLAEVKRTDLSGAKCTRSCIPELDRAVGGFYEGELSVWTAKRGEGKSTLLGQLLLQAVDQGHSVCAYSGELPKEQFKQWVSIQAAGPNNIVPREDKRTGKVYYTVPDHIQKRIDEWWDRRFFLYDLGISTAHDEDSILDIFTLAHRCYGCDVFLVDNIMTARFKSGRDIDYYRAQSNFTGRLVSFAKRHKVHVHLVAHPRKTGNASLAADDVGGSGEIVNRADNAFSLVRLDEERAERAGFHCGLEVLKNRAFGAQVKVGLDFEPTSRRFYKAGTGSPEWRFGWEFDGGQVTMRDEPVAANPFEEA